jgi:hypothetical protein
MNATRPHSTCRNTKTYLKRKPLTFGDFVAEVYHFWGERRAIGIVRLALARHAVEFRGKERYLIN